MVRFYTLTGAYADAVESRARVNFAIMDIVSEMGLSFAFPSQSVYIESLPEPPAELPVKTKDMSRPLADLYVRPA